MKPQFCSIHLAFNGSCFEAVLIKNTQRTLGLILVPKIKLWLNANDIFREVCKQPLQRYFWKGRLYSQNFFDE